MLTNLRVRGFKCLRDVSVPLAPLTVLIGKNDTGKSSLLDAILALSRVTQGQSEFLTSVAPVQDLLTHGSSDRSVTWDAEITPTPRNRLPGRAAYSIRLDMSHPEIRVAAESLEFPQGPSDVWIRAAGKESRDGLGRPLGVSEQVNDLTVEYPLQRSALPGVAQHNLAISSVLRALSSVAKHQFRSDAIRKPVPLPKDRTTRGEVGPDGTGVPLVLGELAERRSPDLAHIEARLAEAVPSIVGVTTPIVYGSEYARRLGFRLRTGGEIGAESASDGALLYLAYLTLAWGPAPPSILLIEEPENGIHPKRLEDVVRILHHMTSEERGEARVQVILTTHSPYLLDFVAPEQVLVFTRGAGEGSLVRPLTDSKVARLHRQLGMTLGEVWYNHDETELFEAPAR